MANAPLVYWYEGTNQTANEVKTTVNYGTVDADSASVVKTFYIWNNRGGTEDCSKMEEVVFTTRDRQGGTGDTVGNIVEAVRDNWFRVRNDTLGETTFTEVGKGGVGTENPSGVKALSTNGSTTNVNSTGATTWTSNTALTIGTYIKPTTSNGFMYKVETAGTTGATEPSWTTVEGESVTDGTVIYTAVQIVKTPASQELLGLANNTLPDGSNADLAGGNFVQVSVYAEVPITASSGKNLLVQRVSYRFV